jgi:beta-glucosidase
LSQVPAYYNYKPSARRGYLFDEVTPLFPFGFGLSYSSFELSDPVLDKSIIGVGDSAFVNVEVTNTGSVDGATVVQLYVRDKFSSVTRPVKELKGFQKIFLKSGESKTLTFTISDDALAFYDINMDYSTEPGDFDLMTGFSSADQDLKTVTLTVK